MRRVAVVAAVVLALGTAACSQGAEQGATVGSSAAPPPTRPFPVTSWNETFVDTSRVTPPGAETPGAPARTLPTALYLPDAPGPHPLVVFAHGLIGHPDKFTDLLSAWARAGYVVAAPAFPHTSDRVPGALRNVGLADEQPADVSFVIDEVLRRNDDPSSPLHQQVDADRIGAAGLSLGGGTTYAATFSTCCRDERIDAAEVLAGAPFELSGPEALDGHVPLLIVHGDQDPVLPHQLASKAFAGAAPPVWFVTLLGGSHAPPFENDATPYDRAVETLTTRFWDVTLGGDRAALDRFASDAEVDGLTVVEAKAA